MRSTRHLLPPLVGLVLAPLLVTLSLTVAAPSHAAPAVGTTAAEPDPAAVLSTAAATAPAPLRLATGGFGEGDPNSYSWSMAWFKGKLLVGTARSQLCVEGATYDYFFPGEGYFTSPAPDLRCPADRYDLDLRAEIWQYTPTTKRWKRVYQAPADVANPRAPGKFVSRDIGYRGMTVMRDADGTDALYVGGVTANEYIPEIATDHPPRLLRSTDGDHFTPLATGPGFVDNPFGHQRAMGFRSLTAFHGKLYVTATGGLTGDGVVMEVRHPAGPEPTFVQVSPPELQVFELQVFNSRLYVGTGSSTQGYGVWQSATPSDPASYRPVVTGGAGRGDAVDSVVSMKEYKGKLYVGSSGWNSLFPASELIRISGNGRWDLVVGNPRQVGSVTKWPVSGLLDGFGNIFNSHFWRMGTGGGGLYLGTNDWSWAFRNAPAIDALLRPGYGFDLYGTCDGTSWTTMSTNGLGDGVFNYGLRTFATRWTSQFVGSANHAQGTSVWQVPQLDCTAPTDKAATARASGAAAPAKARAQAATTGCDTVVRWQRTAGAGRYAVTRSSSTTVRGITIEPPPRLPNGYRSTVPPTVTKDPDAPPIVIPGPTEQIGTTTGTRFVDPTARPGVHYQYAVRTVDDQQVAAAATKIIRTGCPR